MLLDALALLAATPTTSVAVSTTIEPTAHELSYTYFGIAYAKTSFDGFSDDPDGFTLDASFALNDTWFAYGDLDAFSGEFAGNDVDLDTLRFGFGLHTSIAPNVDLVLGAGLAFLDADSGAPGASDDEALEARAGIRVTAGDRGEIAASLVHDSWSDNDDQTTLHLQGVYALEQRIGLTAGFWSNDDADAFTIGIRFTP